MADRSAEAQGAETRAFELRVQQLFGEASGVFEPADSRAFAARVERRLERDWALRRLAIGVAGAVGGGVAVTQLAGAHVLAQLNSASQATVAAGRGASEAAGRLSVLAPAVADLPLGAEGLWLVAGMAVLAVALLGSRLLDEG